MNLKIKFLRPNGNNKIQDLLALQWNYNKNMQFKNI